MFKTLGVVSVIVGFFVPYASDSSVNIPAMIILQIAFYAIGYYYILKFGD